MLSARIEERVPSARAVSIAQLEGHALHWHKRSRDGSGKCDVLSTGSLSDAVWGVLFEIDRREKPLLDEAEGLHQGYEETRVRVRANERTFDALMYYATTKDASLRPYSWYKAFAVTGAYEHGLPEGYIGSLEATPAISDPDRNRHEKNTKLQQAALWEIVYRTIRPKPKDQSPNACLNRLAKELFHEAHRPLNESTATIRFEYWEAPQLARLETKHKNLNQDEDDRPIVVVARDNRHVLVDGNHRVAKWLATMSSRKHQALVIRPDDQNTAH